METIAYDDNGEALEGLIIRPAGKARASVLVCHEGPGRTPHLFRRLEMLGQLGYAAFALDIFGGGSPPEIDPPRIFGRLRPWEDDRDRLRKRALAGLAAMNEALPAERRLVLGYSFGGTVALELARAGADVDGAVSVYGILKAPIPAEAGVVRARVLSCVGTEDPANPSEDRVAFEAEMSAAGVQFQTIVFGGAKHAFANTEAPPIPGFGYDAWADQQSWAAVISFFEALAGPPQS